MLKRTRIGAALMVAVLITGAMPVFSTAAEAALAQTPVLTVSKPVAQTQYQNTTTVRLDFTDIEVGDATAPKSITALYNADWELESVALGDVTNGKASYAFNVPADVADYTVKSFVWDMENLEPVTGELELTESEFDSMIPAATWDFEGENTADISPIKHLTNEGRLAKGQWGIGFRQQGSSPAKYEVPVQAALSSITTLSLKYPGGNAHWGVDQASEGSENCISVSSTASYHSTGMKVYLTNNQIEPGKKYSMTFYVKNNGINSSNLGIARDIYANLLPWGSAFKWDGKTESEASQIETELPMWTDCYRTSNMGATWIGHSNVANNIADRDAVTVGTWQKQEIILEPEAADFNVDGVTGLYLAFTPNANWSSTLTANEAFYVDDVRITEIKETPAMEWDFEDGSDISTGPELNKWTYAVSHEDDAIFMPSVATADGKSYMQISDTSDTSAKNYLNQTGVKVKLSKEQFEMGKEYELTFRGYGGSQWSSVYIDLLPYGDKTLLNCYNAADTNRQLVPWVGKEADMLDTGAYRAADITMNKSNQMYIYKFTPTEDKFDDNGYANLWVMVMPEKLVYYSSSNSKYVKSSLNPGNTFGFGEITIKQAVVTEE